MGVRPAWIGRRSSSRSRLGGKPLQDLEQDEFGNLLSTAGARRLHSKKSGGQRIFRGAHRSDRIAQMVVKQLIEPDLDPYSCQSYGYRPRENRPWTQLEPRVNVLEI